MSWRSNLDSENASRSIRSNSSISAMPAWSINSVANSVVCFHVYIYIYLLINFFFRGSTSIIRVLKHRRDHSWHVCRPFQGKWEKEGSVREKERERQSGKVTQFGPSSTVRLCIKKMTKALEGWSKLNSLSWILHSNPGIHT